ncbi:CoA-binding protein [Parasediminibacterium sp. JCM 36343]|uniref:CoA-binding protein n=1 Tax=Parasediminibacterium sp. JCM 36343 TaxID=3374279 RepID=UPI00397BA972
MSKKTIVIGASANPERYSYLAIEKLNSHQHEVVAISKKNGHAGDVEIVSGMPSITGVDTITIYLNAQNQKEYYDYILSLHPKRIIFNPGAENNELYQLAKVNGIEPLDACTLVLLSTQQY